MIIISAEREEYNIIQNARRSASMLNLLLDIVQWNGSVVPTIGSWEDTEEQCFCIELNDEVTNDDINRIAEALKKLAKRYHQVALGGVDLENETMMVTDLKTEEYNTWVMLESELKPPDENWVLIKGKYYYPGAEVIEMDLVSFEDILDDLMNQ